MHSLAAGTTIQELNVASRSSGENTKFISFWLSQKVLAPLRKLMLRKHLFISGFMADSYGGTQLMLISNSSVRLLLGLNNESLKSSPSVSLSYIYYSVSSMIIRNNKKVSHWHKPGFLGQSWILNTSLIITKNRNRKALSIIISKTHIYALTGTLTNPSSLPFSSLSSLNESFLVSELMER